MNDLVPTREALCDDVLPGSAVCSQKPTVSFVHLFPAVCVASLEPRPKSLHFGGDSRTHGKRQGLDDKYPKCHNTCPIVQANATWAIFARPVEEF